MSPPLFLPPSGHLNKVTGFPRGAAETAAGESVSVRVLTRTIHEIQAPTEKAWNPISGSIQDRSYWDTDEHGFQLSLSVSIRVLPCPKMFFFLLHA